MSVIRYIHRDDKVAMLQLLDIWEMKGDELHYSEHHTFCHQSAMHAVARRGNCELLAVLLQRKAGINTLTSWGESPLEVAVWADHPHVVRTLLERGAAVGNLLDNWLFDPLLKEHSSEIGGLLIDHAASIGIKPRQKANEPVIKYKVDASRLHMEEILTRAPKRRLAWREVAAISRSAMNADVVVLKQYYDPSEPWMAAPLPSDQDKKKRS